MLRKRRSEKGESGSFHCYWALSFQSLKPLNTTHTQHRAKMLGEKSMQLVNLLQEEPLSLGATTQTWFDESSS